MLYIGSEFLGYSDSPASVSQGARTISMRHSAQLGGYAWDVLSNSFPGNWRGRYIPRQENKTSAFVSSELLQQNSSNGEVDFAHDHSGWGFQKAYASILARDPWICHNTVRWKENYLHTERTRSMEWHCSCHLITHSLIQSWKTHSTPKREHCKPWWQTFTIPVLERYRNIFKGLSELVIKTTSQTRTYTRI